MTRLVLAMACFALCSCAVSFDPVTGTPVVTLDPAAIQALADKVNEELADPQK